jgi:hypothetical protein
VDVGELLRSACGRADSPGLPRAAGAPGQPRGGELSFVESEGPLIMECGRGKQPPGCFVAVSLCLDGQQ